MTKIDGNNPTGNFSNQPGDSKNIRPPKNAHSPKTAGNFSATHSTKNENLQNTLDSLGHSIQKFPTDSMTLQAFMAGLQKALKNLPPKNLS